MFPTLCDIGFVDRRNQGMFVWEVLIERANADACFIGNPDRRETECSFVGQNTNASGEDPIAHQSRPVLLRLLSGRSIWGLGHRKRPRKANGQIRIIVRILDSMSSQVTVTRVINPTALIQIAGHAFLTDPYFEDHWFFPMIEPIGMQVSELPRLSAILGGHGVFDHWHMRSMRNYPHKQAIPVFAATKAMAKKAERAGFTQTEVLTWGETRKVSDDLEIVCVAGEHGVGRHTNNYLLRTPDTTVLVSTEAHSLEPIQQIAANHHVDIAILPIDGLQFLRKQLVMNAEQALGAAELLGAHTLVPIHYSQRSFAGLVRCSSGIQELLKLAERRNAITIQHAPAGQPITVAARSNPNA
jgi:L-ascorbate metabolism protein UlaG (beta-lactamase superfamily)